MGEGMSRRRTEEGVVIYSGAKKGTHSSGGCLGEGVGDPWVVE